MNKSKNLKSSLNDEFTIAKQIHNQDLNQKILNHTEIKEEIKYNTDLTFIKDSNVRIDIERVNGDHDIHAQKPKLVHKIIEKRINGKFFEK